MEASEIAAFKKRLGPAVGQGPEAVAKLLEEHPHNVNLLSGLLALNAECIARQFAREPTADLSRLLTGCGA